VKNATAVIWKMLLVAEQAFRRLKHPELMPVVYRGGTFTDGILVNKEVAA
jgi:putative transposase